MKQLIEVLFFILITNFSLAQSENNWTKQAKEDWPLIGLINNVEYIDSNFNNKLAGCAFLIEYEGDTLAVTCKHALWIAKTDKMKHIDFEGTLKNWVMHPKNEKDKKIITGELINKNRNELIGEDNVNSDWLVFKIKENRTEIKPLKIRSTPLRKNEKLFAVGWSFKDKTGPQRVYEYEYHKTQDGKLLIKDVVNTNESGAGLSGSPIIDSNGELVGITSDYTKDSETGVYYKSPCTTDYLKRILKEKLN